MTTAACRSSVIAGVVGLLAALSSAADNSPFNSKGGGSTRAFQRPGIAFGKTPPELVAEKGDWLAGPPASLARLKGKVVWLQFNY